MSVEGFDIEANYDVVKLGGTINFEEHEIMTSFGIPFRVYVQPSESKSAILTFHDIGTNHTSFSGFFSFPEMRVITKRFTVYHVCAPGHHAKAEPLNCGRVVGDENRLLNDSEKALPPSTGYSLNNFFSIFRRQVQSYESILYPSLDQLAEMLISVIEHFDIKYFIGFGMGAGSNVLMRFGKKHPNLVLALFLLSPNGSTHGYYEWMKNIWTDLPQLQQGEFTDSLIEQLESHWFGYGNALNEDLVGYYEALARSLCPTNLAGYINAYVNRSDLGLVRSLEPPDVIKQRIAKEGDVFDQTLFKVSCCLVCGELASEHASQMTELNGRMDPRKTQILFIPDCTGMLMEECPLKLTLNFLYFLRSEGLVINLTPEKLKAEASILQPHFPEISDHVLPLQKGIQLREL